MRTLVLLALVATSALAVSPPRIGAGVGIGKQADVAADKSPIVLALHGIVGARAGASSVKVAPISGVVSAGKGVGGGSAGVVSASQGTRVVEQQQEQQASPKSAESDLNEEQVVISLQIAQFLRQLHEAKAASAKTPANFFSIIAPKAAQIGDQAAQSVCDTCIQVWTVIAEALGDGGDFTKEKLQKAIDEVCDTLKGTNLPGIQKLCDNVFPKIIDAIYKYLKNLQHDINPRELCQAFFLCPQQAAETQTAQLQREIFQKLVYSN